MGSSNHELRCVFMKEVRLYSHISLAASPESTHILHWYQICIRIFLGKRYFTEKVFTTLMPLRRQWADVYPQTSCSHTICSKDFMRAWVSRAVRTSLRVFRRITANTCSACIAGSAETGRSCRGSFAHAARTFRSSLDIAFLTTCVAA